MKILITNCSGEYYWYGNDIGKTFELVSNQICFKGVKHQVIKSGFLEYFVDYNDAKVIDEVDMNHEVLLDSNFMYWLMTNKNSTWISLIEDIKLYKLINNLKS